MQDSIEKKLLKQQITKLLNKKFRNPIKQRKFLIDCIDSHGYILKENPDQDLEDLEENFDDLYEQFMPNHTSSVNEGNYSTELVQSLAEQGQSSVDPYGFNRTFIHANSHADDKLAELQKRGITYEETQFNKVKEKMEELIVRSIKRDEDSDKILQTALNIYLNILIYYKDNPFGFTDIRGSLKKGYIFLCVYYSLIYNNNYIDRATLIENSDTIRLKDIPLADENMKKIFNGVKGYSFLNKSYHGSINPGKFLSNTVNIKSKELLKKIEIVIEETKSFVPLTKLGIYSIIYFVCNDYLPFKVKIMYNENETRVTYKILNEVFGSFASATVRKITDSLLKFYRK
jgi:hypothetical protein